MQTPVYDGMVLDSADDQAQYADDKRLVVIFYKRPVQNKTKTTAAGRPIFDEFDYVKILTPGSKDTFETEVQDSENGPSPYKLRFAAQWAQYQANSEQSQSGTPIDQVPWLTVGQMAEFKAVNVRTVEQLVGMPDNLSQKFMGHFQIKQRAQAFLEAAGKAAPGIALAEQLKERDEKIAALEQQMQNLINAQAAKATVTATKLIPNQE